MIKDKWVAIIIQRVYELVHVVVWYHLENLKNMSNTYRGVFFCYQDNHCHMGACHTFQIVQMISSRTTNHKHFFEHVKYQKMKHTNTWKPAYTEMDR